MGEILKLRDISLSISEKEYRDDDSLSSSFLSSLNRLGINVINDKFVSNEATIFGEVTEQLLFNGKLNDDIIIKDVVSVGDTLKSCIDSIFDHVEDMSSIQSFEDFKAESIHILNKFDIDYWKNKDIEWRVDKIIKEGYDYINHIIISSDTKIISNAGYDTSRKCVETLNNHPFTKEIFNPIGKDCISQFKGKFKLFDLWFKFMVDWLIIDHEKKLIIPYDLKTGGKPVEEFSNSYYYWRYDIQGLIYTIGIEKVLKVLFPDYQICSFTFVYISRNNPNKVLKYQMTRTSFDGAMYGYKRGIDYYKGVRELVEEYKWYFKNSFNVDYPEKIYKSNGLLKIDDDIVINNRL